MTPPLRSTGGVSDAPVEGGEAIGRFLAKTLFRGRPDVVKPRHPRHHSEQLTRLARRHRHGSLGSAPALRCCWSRRWSTSRGNASC